MATLKEKLVVRFKNAGAYTHKVFIKNIIQSSYFNVFETSRTSEAIEYLRRPYDPTQLKLFDHEDSYQRKKLVSIPATEFNIAVFDIVGMINKRKPCHAILNKCLDTCALHRDDNTLVISIAFCRALRCKDAFQSCRTDESYTNIFRLYYIEACLNAFKETTYFKSDYQDVIALIGRIARNGSIYNNLNTLHAKFKGKPSITLVRSLHNVLLTHEEQRPCGEYSEVGSTFQMTPIEQITAGIVIDVTSYFECYNRIREPLFRNLPRVKENYNGNKHHNTKNKKTIAETSIRRFK